MTYSFLLGLMVATFSVAGFADSPFIIHGHVPLEMKNAVISVREYLESERYNCEYNAELDDIHCDLAKSNLNYLTKPDAQGNFTFSFEAIQKDKASAKMIYLTYAVLTFELPVSNGKNAKGEIEFLPGQSLNSSSMSYNNSNFKVRVGSDVFKDLQGGFDLRMIATPSSENPKPQDDDDSNIYFQAANFGQTTKINLDFIFENVPAYTKLNKEIVAHSH